MMRKLSLTEIKKVIKHLINENTEIKFVDHVEVNQPAPFCYVEVANTVPKNTKTMFVTVYNLHLRLVSKSANSSIQHDNNIQQIEEAFTNRLILPDTLDAFNQTDTSIVADYIDPKTNERNAVIGLSLTVAYGFKAKN